MKQTITRHVYSFAKTFFAFLFTLLIAIDTEELMSNYKLVLIAVVASIVRTGYKVFVEDVKIFRRIKKVVSSDEDVKGRAN